MDLVEVRAWRRAADRSDLALLPGETVVAGGTWLFSEPQPGTTGLVDLTTLGWPSLTETEAGITVAATCTIAELARAPHPGLATLAAACADALLMSFKVQRAATVGGNLCLGLPAGAMTALCVALDGVAVVWQPDGGTRREPVASFVRGVGQTTLAPGEILRAVELPASALAQPTAVRQTSLAPHGRSASLVVGRTDSDTFVLTVTGATTRPVVLRLGGMLDLEPALAGIDCWFADPHGAADWRAAVTGVLAAEVLSVLVEGPVR
ncbi:FAD binding domain-containing protein [Nocardioides acrostichi]|uniref:FAD binding domain-containing protein n=1 Tax=Nocardioides acrostichi TaxID=2784339 RepID=A0A930Y5G7_9ACTN|nr:FAD binding domain-containing protein [Nocardioides acrostichi]MBF4161225.1 FAD binding domain-containing protein [Nocardioides acrostichi]